MSFSCSLEAGELLKPAERKGKAFKFKRSREEAKGSNLFNEAMLDE